MTAEPHDALAQLLIDAYLAAFGREAGAENFWAWDVLDTLVGRRPDIAWPILLRLVQRMPEEGLGDLAAGPIEDFLSQHGPRAIDAVEAEAATNPRLRRALSMVWRLGMTDDVWRRVQSLADPWPDGEEPEDPSSRRRLELALDGAPPTPGGDEAARRGLIAAAREAKPDGQEPWSTPVYLELRLETGDRPLLDLRGPDQRHAAGATRTVPLRSDQPLPCDRRAAQCGRDHRRGHARRGSRRDRTVVPTSLRSVRSTVTQKRPPTDISTSRETRPRSRACHRHPQMSRQSANSVCTVVAKAPVWRSTSAAVVPGDISAMFGRLWRWATDRGRCGVVWSVHRPRTTGRPTPTRPEDLTSSRSRSSTAGLPTGR